MKSSMPCKVPSFLLTKQSRQGPNEIITKRLVTSKF
uniref:Uncharacterized protein n=1 Tax=Arundo donax TaxID=35708 RepID=A0A0A9EYC9_ARUDO